MKHNQDFQITRIYICNDSRLILKCRKMTKNERKAAKIFENSYIGKTLSGKYCNEYVEIR